MPVLSAIFLVLGLALAVTIGPQTRPWTWGPALLCLAGAAASALPTFLKRGRSSNDLGFVALGVLACAWFAWRAWFSPVKELGQADILLLLSALSGFLSIRAIIGNETAERVIAWGVGLVLLASLVVVGLQISDRSFSPVFRNKAASNAVSGFFGHYIDGSSFLVVTSMMTAAWALMGKDWRPLRVLLLLIAISGITAVWFTRSRGGILAAPIALGAFSIALLIVGHRRNAKWFVPALVGVPLIGIGLGFFLFHGWSQAQEARGGASEVSRILDDVSRLYFLGVAMSCIQLHPMSGGGARSFSWECYRFVEGKDQGDIISARPEYVHNELMQAFTDYGIIGGVLLLAVLGAAILGGLVRLIFANRKDQVTNAEAWRLAGFSALAGMLAMSCFSFIFHSLPGALLLGIALGQVSYCSTDEQGPAALCSKVLLSIASVGSCLLLIQPGWVGAKTTFALWPTHYSKNGPDSIESKIESLTAALKLMPHSSFYQERAIHFQTLAGAQESPDFRSNSELAIRDFTLAAELHPFEPAVVVNRANLLSQLGRTSEAEAAFENAIRLQGGMEPGFRGHFSLAKHFLRDGLRFFESNDISQSHQALEKAAEQMEIAVTRMHWIIKDMNEPRLAVHESLGAAREATGDLEGALEAYDFATTLHLGRRAHYRAGVLIGRQAVDSWTKRKPSEAMTLFIEAKRRVGLAASDLPAGVTPSDRIEYLAYLDRSIDFLKGAKVTPAP